MKFSEYRKWCCHLTVQVWGEVDENLRSAPLDVPVPWCRRRRKVSCTVENCKAPWAGLFAELAEEE